MKNIKLLDGKLITKDNNGLFIDNGTMYDNLPFYVLDEEDETLYLVDEDNWFDWFSNFSKERFKYYYPKVDEK